MRSCQIYIDPFFIRQSLFIPAQCVVATAHDWRVTLDEGSDRPHATFLLFSQAVARATEAHDWIGLTDTIEWDMFRRQHPRLSVATLGVSETLRDLRDDPPTETGWALGDFGWLAALEEGLDSLEDALGNRVLADYYAAILRGGSPQLTPSIIEALATRERDEPRDDEAEEIAKRFAIISQYEDPATVRLPEPAATLNRFFWDMSSITTGTQFDDGRGNLLLSLRARAYLLELFGEHIRRGELHKISIRRDRADATPAGVPTGELKLNDEGRAGSHDLAASDPSLGEKQLALGPDRKPPREVFDPHWLRQAIALPAGRIVDLAERWRGKSTAVPADDASTGRAFGRYVDAITEAAPAAHTLVVNATGDDWRDFQEEQPNLAEAGKLVAEGLLMLREDQDGIEEWSRFESFIRSVQKLVELLDADSSPKGIPPGRRTRPLSLGKAALLMGYATHQKGKNKAKQPAENLRKAMNDGSIRFIKMTRQSFVFDMNDFPSESRDKLRPPMTP